jgi:hypothetical protein
MGVNVAKVRKDFNSLLNNTPTATGGSDVLSKYKNGLKQL